MNRLPTDPTHLRELARNYIETAKKGLQETGNFMPVIVLFDAMDGTANELIGIDGNIMNNPDAKEKLATMVKDHIKAHGYTGSLMMSDTYRLMIPPEKEKVFFLMKKMLGIDNPTAAKMGLGTMTEAIHVSVETIDHQGFIMNVEYKREKGTDSGKAVEFSPETEIPAEMDKRSRFRFFGDDDDGPNPESTN